MRALRHLLVQRLLQVDDHHDARLHGGAEERDEADPDGDGEVVAEQPEQVNAAGQRERHGQQDMCGFERRVVREIEQEEDDDDGDRDDDLEPLPRAHLVFVAAAPADEVAGRQRHARCDRRLGVVDEAADVAPLHVHQHRRQQQPVFRRDHRGAARLFDVSHLRERNLLA